MGSDRVSSELLVPFVVGEGSEESFAEHLIQRMKPWNTGPTYGGMTAMEIFCHAIAAPYETLLEVAIEEGTQGEVDWLPAWSKLLNVEECPYQYLQYLGMFVGTKLPIKATEREARNQLHYGCNLNRGTRRHMEYAITEVLGPEESFLIEERTNAVPEEKAYHFLVYVRAGKITNALYEAINSAKPAGLIYEIIEEDGVWLQGGKKWSEIEGGKDWTEMLEGDF